jgi:hypothetical protein
MGAASRDVSGRTIIWCLAYLYSECYGFRESLAYAVTHKDKAQKAGHVADHL